MKAILFSLTALALTSGCGIARMTEETRDQVVESNRKQGELLSKVKMQALDQTCGRLAFTDPRLDAATEYERLAALTPYARECGKEGSPTDLIELSYLLLKTVNTVGNNPEGARTRYYALGTLAAYMPDEKFGALIDEQITQGGRYYSEAHQVAALRFHFINKYRLQPIFDETGRPDGFSRVTLTQLKEAVGFYKQLAAIAHSPYRDRFVFISGDHEMELDLAPVSRDESRNWLADFDGLNTTIADKFNAAADPADRASPQAQELLNQLK